MENKIRGDIHVLMVGDPGTGKSRLLYAAKRLSNKAIMTTGMGTSAAGLTVAAMKDKNSNEWVLEAGALALADRGVCCIDEFSLLKNEDKSSIHEIMQQQTLNVSKAGIHCQVNMRATIIAACNPTISGQKIDKTMNICENTGILSSLVSRFDLIFMIQNNTARSVQETRINYIMSQYLNNNEVPKIEEKKVQDNQKINQSWLKDYISSTKIFFYPNVSDQAQLIFKRYYYWIRKSHFISKERRTARMFEGLIRLGQAHARFLMSNTVSQFDAIMVVQLNQYCNRSFLLQDYQLVPIQNQQQYHQIEKKILIKFDIEQKLKPYQFRGDARPLVQSLAISPTQKIYAKNNRVYSNDQSIKSGKTGRQIKSLASTDFTNSLSKYDDDDDLDDIDDDLNSNEVYQLLKDEINQMKF